VIETTVPEINVSELMERVRAEAARPKAAVQRQPLPGPAVPLPPVAMLPGAPAVWIPGGVKSIKERLDRLIQTARLKNEGGSGVPKFLRRFFRKQGGYNRAALDGIAALAKSNHELTHRVSDISVCLGQLNGWLLSLHEQSDADSNWMKAAAPRFAKLEHDLIGLENQLQSTGNNVDQRVAAVRESVDKIQRQITENGATTAAALEEARADRARADEQANSLRRDFDNIGIHLRNLQAQTDALSHELAETGKTASHLDRHKDQLQHQVDLAGVHLRNLQAQADRLGVHINDLQGFVEKKSTETTAIHHDMEQRLADQADLSRRVAAFEERTIADAALVKGELSEYGALFRRLLADSREESSQAGKKNTAGAAALATAVPGLDSFYLAFENRFRGSRDVIKKRVEFYLPFLRDCRAGVRGRPVLDLGCGRGEWLELLKEHKLTGVGVDLNTAMVAQCNARGLKVQLGDAVEHLSSLRAATQGAVTAFHLIEHLPFETLLAFFREARRVLKPGGVAIFESPNCKNLIVGACNFHIDPTHRHPVFPETAEFMLGAYGFEKIRIEYLSPVAEAKFNGTTPELATLRDLLFGPQDFGIIAYKPKAR
jgi:SAM-dependent methyltransferase